MRPPPRAAAGDGQRCALLLPALAALAALSVACRGGQTQGEAFDPRWKDDGGAGIAAFQRRFAGRPVPVGVDVAVGVVAAPGVISMTTGAFTQTGSILVPYAAVYGPDLLIYGAARRAVRGVLWYG
ncbi:hypothetical protein [Sorangium sp. So ce385]|uniref:hypothetical protein n=1 Tax=Sorangium sp. So ce385 TaxID=3133308 RepID=UPI003F5B6ADB